MYLESVGRIQQYLCILILLTVYRNKTKNLCSTVGLFFIGVYRLLLLVLVVSFIELKTTELLCHPVMYLQNGLSKVMIVVQIWHFKGKESTILNV